MLSTQCAVLQPALTGARSEVIAVRAKSLGSGQLSAYFKSRDFFVWRCRSYRPLLFPLNNLNQNKTNYFLLKVSHKSPRHNFLLSWPISKRFSPCYFWQWNKTFDTKIYTKCFKYCLTDSKIVIRDNKSDFRYDFLICIPRNLARNLTPCARSAPRSARNERSEARCARKG